MVTIPPINMVMTGRWLINLLKPHYTFWFDTGDYTTWFYGIYRVLVRSRGFFSSVPGSMRILITHYTGRPQYKMGHRGIFSGSIDETRFFKIGSIQYLCSVHSVVTQRLWSLWSLWSFEASPEVSSNDTWGAAKSSKFSPFSYPPFIKKRCWDVKKWRMLG